MEIAGSTCNSCKRPVTFAVDGKVCPNCRVVVHLGCEPEEVCGRCERPYEKCERPIPDPVRDALLPRALRMRSPGPTFVVLTTVVVAVLLIVSYYVIMDSI